MTRDPELQALIDRQKIYEVLVRYCRGLDRADRELIRSVYHEDAIDDHGMFRGRGVEFADWIVDRMGNFPSQHFIGNFACELRGDVAYTETYCITFGEFGATNGTVYCRYIDRFERRNGEWKIADRKLVLDLSRLDPTTARYGEAEGFEFTWGSKGRSDPSYRST